ncbi:hypothetical protein AOCH_003938 [Aspergillus ochraceoroseus]|uniref:DUF6590 domain-containing protein n=2 Tax=Aspergillus ochraceoroseus TaxID=138278 RepID=A0A0F8U5P6_9EURO|nr:hypothetical protein AOCH_003938 [Aspergillus ochraceoroseus]
MSAHHYSRDYRGASARAGANQNLSEPAPGYALSATPRTAGHSMYRGSSPFEQPVNTEESPNYTYRPGSILQSPPHSVRYSQTLTPNTLLVPQEPSLNPRPAAQRVVRSEYRISAVLDPRYVVQSNHYFRVGKVFSVLWHENDGRGKPGTYLSTTQFMGKFGEPIYSTIRRMVVVKVFSDCSWCFPISTYGGQGVAKSGVNPSKHAMVYMTHTRPTRSVHEPEMTKEPLEVSPARYDERLDEMSRLNFGKIYTVEHNVKVLPIGEIASRSMSKFLNYARPELAI